MVTKVLPVLRYTAQGASKLCKAEKSLKPPEPVWYSVPYRRLLLLLPSSSLKLSQVGSFETHKVLPPSLCVMRTRGHTFVHELN